MKRFEFRLESLLGLRRHAEESAKRAFGAARSAADRQAEDVKRFEAAEAEAKTGLRGASGATELRIADVLAHQRFVAAQARRAASERKRLADLDAAAAKAREAFVAASRDRKALDRLRERRESEWSAEALKDEQKALDEAASRREGEPR